MGPDAMRTIDYWVGVPICFVLTLLHKVSSWFRRPSAETYPPRDILLIELIEMGTIVVAYPAIRKLKEQYPEARLRFLCFRGVRPSVEVLQVISPDDILTIDNGSLFGLVRDSVRFAWRARRERIDTVVNLEHFVRFSSILSYLTGARNRVGFHRFHQEGIYCGDFLTHKVAYNTHIHTAHTFLDLVAALNAPADSEPRVKRSWVEDDVSVPVLTTDAARREQLAQKLRGVNPSFDASKKLVIVNPNASKLLLIRKLPIESYAELAKRLLEDEQVFVGITGVAEEKPDAQHICRAVDDERAMDLTGLTTFDELLYLFDLADVLVTNDSGPAHFASLTSTHVIALFGPETPLRYRPLSTRSDVVYSDYSCSPCVSPFNQRRTPCNDNLCMQAIGVDELYSLVRDRLAGRRAEDPASTSATGPSHGLAARAR